MKINDTLVYATKMAFPVLFDNIYVVVELIETTEQLTLFLINTQSTVFVYKVIKYGTKQANSIFLTKYKWLLLRKNYSTKKNHRI